MSAETEIAEQQGKTAPASRGLPAATALVPGSDLRPALAVAAILAIVVALGLPGEFEPMTRLICFWDILILVMLAKMWRIIARSTSESCRLRASADDPGILIILIVSVFGGIAGLVGAVFLVRRPDPAMLQVGLWLEMLLVSIAVAGGWLLLQSANTLHYAKLYYADDGTPGGLK